MITELRVHNFRTFVNASFRFKRRHLLIGKNTSGKTNLGLAMLFPRYAAVLPIAEAVGGATPGGNLDFCNYSVDAKDRISLFGLRAEIECGGQNLIFSYAFAVSTADPRRMIGRMPVANVLQEGLTVTGGPFKDTALLANDAKTVRLLQEDKFLNGEPEAYTTAPAPGDSTMLAKLYEAPGNSTAIRFRDFLRGIAYYNFAADRIRTGWAESRNCSSLESNGSNLAQMLFALKTGQESRYRRLLERVRRIEPRLLAVNFLTGPEQRVVPVVELEGGRTASWASLSDGTLHSLALSYLFEFVNIVSKEAQQPPPVYIIEEPENSLFVGELSSLLYDAENVAPLGQLVFTTHSPYFLDHFDDDLEAVTLLERQGWITTGKSLSERRSAIEAALEQMSLGEQFFREMLG